MKILNLTREDMIERFKDINLEDIQPYCFYFETNEEIRQADLVIMREDNKYKVLKTRTDTFDHDTGELIDKNASWNDALNKYVPKMKCPVCE